MRQLKPSLSVIVMLIACGCSSNPSLPQTVERQPATACLTPCTPIPDPVSGHDRDIRTWEFDANAAFGACRRLHADCIESVIKQKE